RPLAADADWRRRLRRALRRPTLRGLLRTSGRDRSWNGLDGIPSQVRVHDRPIFKLRVLTLEEDDFREGVRVAERAAWMARRTGHLERYAHRDGHTHRKHWPNDTGDVKADRHSRAALTPANGRD